MLCMLHYAYGGTDGRREERKEIFSHQGCSYKLGSIADCAEGLEFGTEFQDATGYAAGDGALISVSAVM